MRRHAALLLTLAASACATHPIAPPPNEPEPQAQAQQRRAHAPKPAYNLAGYPAAVREGYIDGCESARRSEYARKDARRMEEDRQYAMGWNDGFSICGKR
ncbi:MAG TPA: hypothetical protein VFE23_04290 [Usitatibacter sp.]|jgi:hypothetical protein|nr:hypothetical protein [Usitatibacter sp.]